MIWNDVDLGWAYSELLSSIYRQTRCIDRAFDVLHDSFLRLATTSRRDQIIQPHAYLRTVVQSILADQGRVLARWLPFPDNDESEDVETHPNVMTSRKILAETVDPQSFAPSPEHLAEVRERLRALQRIMDTLPPRCRKVFWLLRVEGYTQPEIAARLGITVKTVEYHVKRALVELLAASQDLR